MVPNPTLLILLHHYRQAYPAIDESDFRNHGLCHQTVWQSDGAKVGSDALAFDSHAIVRVPISPSWANLRGLIVDVMVRFDGSDMQSRRNLVEGDGCFAMYVAQGGEFRFDFFGFVSGQSTPGWHGVSSVTNALGGPQTLEPGRWYRLRAAFDGITTAKLWIDGVLAAQRSGFRSSIGSPGGAGVTIGNWTLSHQFPLMGVLDWVAIWKVDEDAGASDFMERLDPTATHEWSRIAACLDRSFDEETISILLEAFEALLVDIGECLALAQPDVRAEFSSILAKYHDLWRAGLANGPAFAETVARMHKLLAASCPATVADSFGHLTSLFREMAARRRIDCVDPKNLEAADPPFAAAFARFSTTDFG